MDCYNPCGYPGADDPSDLLVLGGVRGNALQAGLLRIEEADKWRGWYNSPPVYAAGRKALVMGNGELLIVDGSDPARPMVERTELLHGYIEDLEIKGNTALLSLGFHGAQTVALGP